MRGLVSEWRVVRRVVTPKEVQFQITYHSHLGCVALTSARLSSRAECPHLR